jgi:broad specificity phosphatase PhoE
MTKPTTIYLVRHGESESNRQGIISGHSDYELTEQGKEQVRQTKQELGHIHFDEVYSSDLMRAIQTAEILYGKPVEESNKMHVLRERDFGSLDGKPQDVYNEYSLQKQRMTKKERWTSKHVPDMESDEELAKRFLPAVEKIARDNAGKTILIAAHGSAIRTAIMQITGYTYKQLPAGSFANAAYAELRYDSKTGFKVIQISGVKL